MIRTALACTLTVLLAHLSTAAPAHARTETVTADVCVYGGTAAGAVAAITVAREGRTVILIEPGRHLGGMTTGGLGWTDFGNKGAIGGTSRDFYRRLGAAYGRDEAWTFEPSVAEKTLNEMVTEAKVPVLFEHRLAGIDKPRRNIRRIILEKAPPDELGAPAPAAVPGERVVVEAQAYIDATYEGDLMAKAGVSYTVGREAVAKYDEPLNGIRANTPSHQFRFPVDPYVNRGYPSSGLVPLIQDGDGGKPGDGDRRVQAYNFRLCLTQNPDNRIPIEAPPGYDPARYELLARHVESIVEAGQPLRLKGVLLKLDMVPNGKTDINNHGAVSTDYIGHSWDYPDGDWATRSRIWKEHIYYIRGLLYFLGHSERVPEMLREEMLSWGFCKDEFQDTGGWPHEMYIREARRMVSDFVVTQAVCQHEVTVDDSIGLASYNMDSHNCQRLVKDELAQNEGDVQVGPKGPYPVPYRAIRPRQRECENLLVPVCVSASHIAYGSIRMEPVFMLLAQSAATAACMAVEQRVPVQQIDVKALQEKLLAAGQILEWSGPTRRESTAPSVEPAPLKGIVVDDDAAVKTGEWVISTAGHRRRAGTGYVHDGNESKGKLTAAFTPEIPGEGDYEIVLLFPPDPNRATNVPVTIAIEGGESKTVLVSEKGDAEDAGATSLGRFHLPAGKKVTVTISNRDTDGHVVADGVQFLPVGQ